MNKKEPTKTDPDTPYTQSPPWPAATKRVVQALLIVLLVLILYRIRGLLAPLVTSMVLAYALEPIVRALTGRTRFSRTTILVFVYLTIIGILVAIPVGTVPRLVAQVNTFINNVPAYLIAVGDYLREPVQIAGIEIPLDELQLEQIYVSLSTNIIDILRSVGTQSFTLFGSLASATLSTVGWMVVILVISFYFVKDYRQMWRSLVGLVPTDFQPDVYHLGKELTVLWNEFFRGRLLLCVIVGVMTFAVIRVIGIPNAFALSLIAGIGEFIPNVGPILATIPAVLVALFQADASWLGTMVGPVWLSLIVIGIYVVISQLENTILVPRVIGRSLNMHPIVVFIAALAGASVAGLLGILLAAPVLASGRVIFVYVYRKLNDLPPFPDLAQEGVLPAEDE